jgi:choline dehydrogenase-like flavoprotein
VVNADQQSFDHSNLFLLGSGTFPTVGTANPTLTIAALAFRASRAVLKQLAPAR